LLRYCILELESYVVLLLRSLKYYDSNFFNIKEYASLIVIFGLILEFILYFLFQCSTENFRDRRASQDNFVECSKINTRNLQNYMFVRAKRIILSRLVPFAIILIIYIFYNLEVPVEIILLSFILAFLIFTNFTFCVGYYEAHYREADVYLKNSKSINGIILKQGPYVNVLTEDGTFLINKDDISTIKMSKNSKELCCDYKVVNRKLTSFLRKIW
jgi:hypothetical protein